MARRGEKTLFQVSKLLCIASLLLVASAANARPTVTSQDIILTTAGSSPLDIPTIIPSRINGVVEPIGVELTNLAKEFLQPPANSAGLTGTQANLAKPLPAEPGAILMVLAGFLCVSLVKDRRLWLTALTALLWAGQTGIQALPQLASRLSHRNHNRQQLGAELSHSYYLENSSRPRCDIEGTEYIGLLHHLAGIPDGRSNFATTHITFISSQELYGKAFSYSRKNAYPHSFAIIPEKHSSNSLFNCLVPKAEQFTCFTPAFIFENLPRGPPIPA